MSDEVTRNAREVREQFPDGVPDDFIPDRVLLDEARELMRRITHLLDQTGSRGTCRGCDRPVMWVRHKNGKLAPYTLDGLNHFADCPAAERFRNK